MSARGCEEREKLGGENLAEENTLTRAYAVDRERQAREHVTVDLLSFLVICLPLIPLIFHRGSSGDPAGGSFLIRITGK